MTVAVRPRPTIRFRGRSFLALVLAPDEPLETWLAEIDLIIARSTGFFVGRPIVLDVSELTIDKDGLAALVEDLGRREIRIMGIEGAHPSLVGPGMPPAISGGRQTATIEAPEIEAPAASGTTGTKGAGTGTDKPATPAEPAKKSAPTPLTPPTAAETVSPKAGSLLVETPVRSGQSIIFLEGDVTVVGSVASGAEIIAGGSIHVYGTLRGRALAGTTGNSKARIFCNKLEAELVAIDGLYTTAEEMDQDLRGKPVQVQLDGDTMMMTTLA